MILLALAMPAYGAYIDAKCGYRIELDAVEKRDEPCSVAVEGVTVTLPKSAPKKPEDAHDLTRGRWRGWSSPTGALLRDPSGRLAFLEGERARHVMRHFVFLNETSDAWCTEDNLNQSELNQCKYAQYLQADSRLVAIWEKLIAGIGDEESKTRLQKAHELWLTFRKTSCDADAYTVAGGGSLEPFVYNECRTDVTLDRIEQLESLIEWRND